jgi:hypothetical protein
MLVIPEGQSQQMALPLSYVSVLLKSSKTYDIQTVSIVCPNSRYWQAICTRNRVKFWAILEHITILAEVPIL